MINKRKIIFYIIYIGTIFVVFLAVGLYGQNKLRHKEERVKDYERIVDIAQKVNDEIDEKLAPTKEFIATNPNVRSRYIIT